MPSPTHLSKPVYKAGGNVRPLRIITPSASVAQSATETTAATQRPIGITANNVRRPYNSAEDDGYHAIAGEPLQYFSSGEECDALAGAAISALNTPLVSDSAARVITATLPAAEGVRYWFVGWPLEPAAAANEIIRVWVDIRDEYGFETPAP